MSGKIHEVRRLLKALPLFGLSFIDIGVAFVRMFILTHILGPYEFGFAAAISATYAAIAQVTDVALYRFVGSSPRSAFLEALAGAQALSILRGFFLASCILIVSYPLACTFAACNNWPSFAWLALVTIVASFEHLEIRVRERDYRYGPQLRATLAGHTSGIVALTAVAYESGSHYAFLAFLLVQAAVYVVASHLLASSPYRVKWNTPYLRKAFAFGFPLMLNGIGLAIVGQGDRLMVGVLLGLPTLGLYAVVVLAGLVPISGILRIFGPLLFAGLHNARVGSVQHSARLRLFSRMVPMIAGGYALALIALFKTVVPLVFGTRFIISDSVVFLIVLIAFVRVVRTEPHTSLLLNAQETRELALANLSPVIGLVIATGLAAIHPSIETVLVGVLLGEIVGLLAMIFVTRDLLKPAIVDYVISISAMVIVIGGTGALTLLSQGSDNFLVRTAIAGGSCILILAGSGLFLPRPYHAAYISRPSTK